MQEFTVIFISAFIALFLARKAAIKVGLVDKPNARKHHHGHIPYVGGISIYLALWILYAFHPEWLPEFSVYMICASVLLVVGVLDDRFDLPVFPRVVLQAMVAVLMMYFGLHLSTLGNIFFGHEVALGLFGYIVTLFAVWGAINAFNMVDGIDGLLGSLSTVTFGALAVLFWLGGKTELAQWSLCLLIVLIPYIMLNLGIPLGQKFKVFMGDAGSTLIGFTVIWLLILATQGEEAIINPVTALWLIAIPLMDMTTIMVRRILRGHSPFRPDREHLHHILIRGGLKPRQALVVITGFALFLAAIAIVAERAGVAESIMLNAFIVMFVGYFWSNSRICHILTVIRRGNQGENQATLVGKVSGSHALNK
ncbi:undecaprenyl-phosphate alpha-N-acetylglucosaminyl 1-phosphate transferase [Brenneria alni]|uniref:Undecaprenyl-phosphate alpha-N-acetylglucosaminyl 1-phosphate transferase n=1 Tax=Brenneria alni TaxID=71656 RepID=A0A421DQW0_9GAMM|nr:UDP-N-acetylglucosamine--undecaprenyl-phosphate N-acetylglucosaminephosphotransferase [Brenneria alni]RLM26391.1 undecaprenyl-phosphate alpha-N-acetylglucosaminyl 1-phosphate transferase [Brenneria alni]